MLAPIPLSLMALDETRQVGVGYIKNFASVSLAGLVILVLLIAFPIIPVSYTHLIAQKADKPREIEIAQARAK